MLRNVAAVGQAFTAGRSHWAGFRKVPGQASASGQWVDYSMAAGNPKPQYYAATPLASAVLDGLDGIFHGDAKTPSSQHLTHWGLVTPTAAMVGQYVLADYLLFYPFIDGDSLDAQATTTTVTLPRYTDGDGVMVMAVVSAPTTGGGSFTFDYVNHAGDARTSPVINCNVAATSIATLLTSEPGTAAGGQFFLPLRGGDRGVRSITSVQMLSASGGLFALVLVKPLHQMAVREINTTAESDLIVTKPGAPEIVDGAYLGLIGQCAGTVAAGTLVGNCTFIWSA
jgi:hypothetical protein